MDFSNDIIEVLSDGKYWLNENELDSILSKADNYHNFALISTIGANHSGKTFLLNCFINHSETNPQTKPRDQTTRHGGDFYDSPEDLKKRVVVRMYYKPIVLVKDGIKTAVFLMDSCNVFDLSATIHYSKLVQDIIGLFFATSSTVVYLKSSNFMTEELSDFQNVLEKSLKFIEKINSFEELLFLIRDWNPDLRTDDKNMKDLKDYLSALKLINTKNLRYFKEDFSAFNFDKYFHNTECYVMPSHKKYKSRKEYESNLFNLSQLLATKLLIEKLRVKRHPITKKVMTREQLFNVFNSYINKLNDKSVSIDLGIFTQNRGSTPQSFKDIPNISVTKCNPSDNKLQFCAKVDTSVDVGIVTQNKGRVQQNIEDNSQIQYSDTQHNSNDNKLEFCAKVDTSKAKEGQPSSDNYEEKHCMTSKKKRCILM